MDSALLDQGVIPLMTGTPSSLSVSLCVSASEGTMPWSTGADSLKWVYLSPLSIILLRHIFIDNLHFNHAIRNLYGLQIISFSGME